MSSTTCKYCAPSRIHHPFRTQICEIVFKWLVFFTHCMSMNDLEPRTEAHVMQKCMRNCFFILWVQATWANTRSSIRCMLVRGKFTTRWMWTTKGGIGSGVVRVCMAVWTPNIITLLHVQNNVCSSAHDTWNLLHITHTRKLYGVHNCNRIPWKKWKSKNFSKI